MRCVLVTLFIVVAVTATAVAQTPFAGLKPELEKLIAVAGAEKVGVALYDLETKQNFLLNERESFHAASTMKLPVMMEIFRRVKDKKLNLQEKLEVKNRFFSVVDGSEYRLRREDDSDEEPYNRVGQAMTILELVTHMIQWSSNLATNLLIEKVTAEKVNDLAHSLGATDMQVKRGVEDGKAFQAKINNTTTAYDLMVLLQALAERKFASGKVCDQMIEILAGQRFNDGIPAGLPRDTRVAHKTGSITKHNHDAAIVFAPGRKPYVLVVLTRGIERERDSDKLIAAIARTVHQTLAK
ncbi:MAG: serine hydrolase [Acidobacteria bacterium]|nr:serine hydrolase [Acidobacteriota bacterium]MBI3428319.1 serine hydrolase [Acidobacteriota bacterium]